MSYLIPSQVSSSSQMEVEAAERLLRYLEARGVVIGIFATDRSTSIRKMMKIKFGHVKHEFDVWYVI